jgi:hypothetical protein
MVTRHVVARPSLRRHGPKETKLDAEGYAAM